MLVQDRSEGQVYARFQLIISSYGYENLHECHVWIYHSQCSDKATRNFRKPSNNLSRIG